MTAMPQGPWPAQPPPRWGAGRIVALVVGLLLLLPGLGLLAGGGLLLWADTSERTDGYLLSAEERFSTDGYALASERIDLSTGADWVPLSAALGTARIEATAADAADEVFVGIAPEAEGARTSTASSTASSTISASTRPHPWSCRAARRPVPRPTRTSGLPSQRIRNAAGELGAGGGRLDAVVMNADGTAGVSIDARIGATVPALDGLAWGLFGGGLLLLIIGVLLLAFSIRRRPVVVVAPPAAPWTPPAPVDRTTAADAQPDVTRTPPPGG